MANNFEEFEDKVKDELKNFANTKDATNEFSSGDINENKYMAALSYLGPLWFIPFFALREKSPFTKFHLNQGLLLLIAGAVASLVSSFLNKIPLIGLIFRLVFGLVGLVLLAGVFYGLYNALTGKAKELPLIGKNRILD